ncbi:MAG TPA: cytochrome c-type biogenesis protein CcmH [Solirubrobacteraceae bacterium]|nr:cytochrome c-type biogenesis protein CcmH [Solirubrobacteraceae bacterium]
MRIAPLVAAVLAVAVAAAPASGAEPKTSLPDVEDEVMCVTCNVPLNIAESPQADAQREEVRRLVAQGLTKEQVKDRLVAQYGEDVLALPEEDGVGAAAYLVPIAVVLGMLALAAVLLPRWRRRTPAPLTTGGATASEAELKRLDEDLARYE